MRYDARSACGGGAALSEEVGQASEFCRSVRHQLSQLESDVVEYSVNREASFGGSLLARLESIEVELREASGRSGLVAELPPGFLAQRLKQVKRARRGLRGARRAPFPDSEDSEPLVLKLAGCPSGCLAPQPSPLQLVLADHAAGVPTKETPELASLGRLLQNPKISPAWKAAFLCIFGFCFIVVFVFL